MKHKIFKTLFAAVVATMTFFAEAETETVNGIEWAYTVEDYEAILGDGYFFRAIPKSTSGAITIPSTLGGYPVTIIGRRAFGDCTSLTSVTIPDSVTSIGYAAFPRNCRLVTAVGNGARLYKMVGGENIVEEDLTEQKKSELYDNFQTLFGKRIGDKINPYEIERSFYKSGKFHKEFIFTPRKPFLSFNRYIVKVSAQNHQIYSIRAIAEYSPELYKMVKDALEKKYQVWLINGWLSGDDLIENPYIWGVKGDLRRLLNLSIINEGYSGKKIVVEILDKQGEKAAEKESLGDAVDAL